MSDEESIAQSENINPEDNKVDITWDDYSDFLDEPYNNDDLLEIKEGGGEDQYSEEPYREPSQMDTNIYGYSGFLEGEAEDEEGEYPVEEEEEPFISVFDILDAPRDLPEPIDLNLQHLKQIENELGLITLCWPDIKEVTFEGRAHFPESYLKNTDKEKLLLFYAENFRRQFHHKYNNRKPLFLAADNECGQQVM